MSLHDRTFRPTPASDARPSPARPSPAFPRIAERMAPDPQAVLAAFLDLGVTLAETARYFDIPLPCLARLLATDGRSCRPPHAT